MARKYSWLLAALLVASLGGPARAIGNAQSTSSRQTLRRQLRLLGGNAQVRRMVISKLAEPGGKPIVHSRPRIRAQQRMADKAQPPVILNLGGEGELQVAGSVVVDVNLLDDQAGYVIRKNFVREGRNPIVQGDMTKLPFLAGSADGVVGNRVPFHASFAPRVAAEAFRVLKPGAQFKVYSMTGGSAGWIPYLTQAGFTNLHVEGGHLVGTKP
jgi:hypothetical protein